MPPRKQKSATQPSPAAVEIRLWKVIPVLLGTELERKQLMEDLSSMGCLGLIKKPWGFKDSWMMREVLKPPNEFDHTLRSAPDCWTDEVWRRVYRFREGRAGLVNRKDEFVKDKFRGPVNPKDGFAIEDCIEARQWRFLEFLVLVLHPKKPTRVTITLGNTIFGSLSENRKVDWSRIVSGVSVSITRTSREEESNAGLPLPLPSLQGKSAPESIRRARSEDPRDTTRVWRIRFGFR